MSAARSRRLACLAAVFILGGLAGPTLSSQGARTLGGFQLVKEVRVTRTVSEYTYRATLVNGGAALPGATATAVSLSAATTIVDGSLAFGGVAAGRSVVSNDTFSFRQDRTVPFAWANLRWTIASSSYVPAAGVVLQGAGGGSALSALTRKDPVAAAAQDIVNHTILTRLDVAIRPTATVAQINAMLAAVNGGIVTMRPLFPVITVAVPRQASAAGLATLAASVAAMPGIRLAIPGKTLDLAIAPEPPANDPLHFNHLRMGRFPAAWNANALADCTQKTSVLIFDLFQSPRFATLDAVDTQLPGLSIVGAGPSILTHGFNVARTLAAKFDEDDNTGANPFPSCLNLKGRDISGLTYAEWALAVEAMLPPSGNVVINASLQFPDSCSDPCEPANFAVDRAFDRALAGLFMRHLLRPHQDRVLIASAAGNQADDFTGQVYPGASLATVGSPFNVAAIANSRMTWADDASLWTPTTACTPSICFPGLQLTPIERADLDGFLSDLGESTGAPLRHVLIVGSTDASALHLPSAFSESGAQIFAVGESIPTFEGRFVDGTSFSAPQIAALASYLMMMMPERHNDLGVVDDVYSAILAGRRAVPVNFVDAYASVLSLDPSGAPNPATWQVRLALLDANQDHRFDELDIDAFANALLEPPDFDRPIANATHDDGRFDLNGDGYTGDLALELPAIDLDRTGSFQFGAPLFEQVTVQVGASQRTIDENGVNDLDMLCYYAYSPLYTGDTSSRDFYLTKACQGEVAYEGTVSTILQGNGANSSQTVTSNWTVKLRPVGDGTFEASGTVAYANNGSATYPGGAGTCSVTTIQTGTGPVVYFGGFDTGNPADLPGELLGVFDLTDTRNDSCIGNRTIVFQENALSLPFSLTLAQAFEIMHGEYKDGKLVAIVWDYHKASAGQTFTIVGRLELAP